MAAVVCFQPPCLLIRKIFVPVMHFCASHTLQSALESGQKARIVRIDFSAAFDRINHQGILYKLCCVYIKGTLLSIFIQFLSNRSQHVIGVNWSTSCQKALRQCFGPVIFPPLHLGAFLHSENQLIALCRLLHLGGCCAIPVVGVR